MLHRWVAATALAVAVSAAAQDGGSAAVSPSRGPLEGTRWRWVSFTGPDGRKLVPRHPERYWIELQPEGRLALLADCNHGTGKWEAKGAELALQPMASTLMACPPGSLDSRFTQLIRQSKSYQVQGRTLVVTLRESAGVLRLARVEEQVGKELQGAPWAWRGYDSRVSTDARFGMVPKQPGRYQVEFLAGGKLAIRADCNRAGGTWSADGARHLTVDAAVLTRAMCPPDSLSDQFVKLLNEAEGYSFKDGGLVIALKADSGSMSFVRRAASKPDAGTPHP